MFYILYRAVVTQMDAIVKIHQNQHPRSVHFYGMFRKFERSVKKKNSRVSYIKLLLNMSLNKFYGLWGWKAWVECQFDNPQQ